MKFKTVSTFIPGRGNAQSRETVQKINPSAYWGGWP